MEYDKGSPQWWADKLSERLNRQAADAELYEKYYEGRNQLTLATDKYRKEFAKMINGLSDNWMALVVDAVEERLHVEGFRFSDSPADQDVWEVWQANSLDSESELAHQCALISGVSAAMIWPSDDENIPQITIEHASEVVVASQPGNRHRRIAAMKKWLDGDDEYYVDLFLPEGLYHMKMRSGGRYMPREEDWFTPNPFGAEIPVVPFINRPRLNGTGRSEIHEVTSTQDQINKLVADMTIASEFAAYPQRWATGIEPRKNPDTGEDEKDFLAAIDRLWFSPEPDTKFGSFTAADLRNYIGAIENRIQSLASRTRTPPHYLLGGMAQFPSGESLRAAETGLVSKVRSKQRHFGESWEEVMRLHFVLKGDARATFKGAETIWRDPETRTQSELTDSLVKLKGLGVPDRALQELYGFTPTQIDRFPQMLRQQAMVERLAGPTSAAPAVPQAEQDPTPFTEPDANS